MTKGLAILVLAVLVVAIGLAAYLLTPAPASEPVSNGDEAAIRSLVTEFGSKFKNVALLAPDAGEQIAREYGPYVSEALILGWQDNLEAAPGRQTSSPWPDRLEAVELKPLAVSATGGAKAYQVEGNVIEITSAEAPLSPAGVYPVTLRVEKVAGALPVGGQAWQVTGYQAGAYSEIPQQATVTGRWECLPHRDSAGPQTLECTFGIALDQSDNHLAINTTLMSQALINYTNDTKVRISGVLMPANQLSSDVWKKYDIDGVINAVAIEKL
jgi:hypothetical protein